MKDPTNTITIRNRAIREVNVKFTKLKRFVRESFSIGGLIQNVAVAPNQYVYMRDADKIDAFNRQLQQTIDDDILAGSPGKDYWLNVHVGDGYERGAKKTRMLVERGILNVVKLPDYSPFTNPAHIERAETIYTRVFNDMKGVTDTMRGQMSSVLSDGMLKGKNPKVVAAQMVDRVDAIGMTRARLIARTEIVRAHNVASTNEAEILSIETGIDIKMLWTTSMDGRERETHGDRHKNIYPREQALALTGEPNCRCSISAYIDIANIGKKS